MMLADADVQPAPSLLPAGLDRPSVGAAPQWSGSPGLDSPAGVVIDENEADDE